MQAINRFFIFAFAFVCAPPDLNDAFVQFEITLVLP